MKNKIQHKNKAKKQNRPRERSGVALLGPESCVSSVCGGGWGGGGGGGVGG